MLCFRARFLEDLAGVCHDYCVKRQDQGWIWDGGNVIFYGERVDVENFLGTCLQNVIECAEAFLVEIFGFQRGRDFKGKVELLTKGMLACLLVTSSMEHWVEVAGRMLTMARICFRRGLADARITLFPRRCARTGMSSGNGPRGNGLLPPAPDTARGLRMGNSPCSIEALS